jgi:hypothetical protein
MSAHASGSWLNQSFNEHSERGNSGSACRTFLARRAGKSPVFGRIVLNFSLIGQRQALMAELTDRGATMLRRDQFKSKNATAAYF